MKRIILDEDSLEKTKEQEVVVDAWIECLRSEGYEHHIANSKDCKKLKLTAVWKRILKHTKFADFQKVRILEVGCGGGFHLAQLAAMGCKCIGIDVSGEVLRRANNYFNEIRNVCGLDIDIHLIHGDFLTLKRDMIGYDYDLVFNVGVVEHLLSRELRLQFLKKKYELVKAGGHIVSIVPNGLHPLRGEFRQHKLGGYNVPEIDYDP